MTDTARLQVVIEAQNRSGPGLEAFRREVEGAGVSLERLTLRANNAARATGTVTLTGGAAGIDAFRSGIERATGGAVTLTQQINRIPGGLRASSDEMSKLVQGIGHGLGLFSSFGAGIGTAVVTAAIVGAVAKTAQATGEFERQVRGTNALLDLTGEKAEHSFGRMQRDVRAAGVELGVGATNAAKGLYDTISAGIPVGEEAFRVLRASSRLAVGGMTDLATATDGVTSVLNAYRLTAADVDRVTDQMFATQNIGKITVAQLGQNIGTVVPLAAALGVSFAEVGGSIAAATQQGLRPGQAIEGLRAALQAFLKPSDDAAKLAASLGVGFDAATIRSKGFAGALADVVKATGGSEALLGRLFGDVQAINFAFSVTGQNAPATARAIQQVGAASGTSARAAEEVERSGARAFERFGARAEELGLKIGSVVLPPITAVLEGVTNLGAALGAWPTGAPPQEQVERFAHLAKGAKDAEQAQNQLNQAIAREKAARQNVAPVGGFTETLAPPDPTGAFSARQREVAQAAMSSRELTVGVAGLGSRISETASRAEAFLSDVEILERNFRTTNQSVADFQRDLQRLTEAQAEASRQADLGNAITVVQARVLLDAASANKTLSAAAEENKRQQEELARTMEQVAGAQKQLAQFAEQAPGRAEQDALRQLREGLQGQETAEQRRLEGRQRGLEEQARSLQESAEKGRDALQSLRDAAADARGELEALARVRVQGTNEQENRVFALGTRAAQDQLVIEQARLARLQARQAGQPRPPVDRTAIRAAARDQVVAEQEARVTELQGRTTLAPAQRAVDQALNPPQELPGGDLLRRAQAARAAVTRVEGESDLNFQRRTREAEAQVRSQEREAQAKQREAQEQARSGALRLQGIRDRNQGLLDEAEQSARNAEIARQRAEYERQLQAIIDARNAKAAQLRSQGVPEDKILAQLNAPPAPNAPDLRLPAPPPAGAAGAIANIGARAGVEVKLPPEFGAHVQALKETADKDAANVALQQTAAAAQQGAAGTQGDAAATQRDAAQKQRENADAIQERLRELGELRQKVADSTGTGVPPASTATAGSSSPPMPTPDSSGGGPIGPPSQRTRIPGERITLPSPIGAPPDLQTEFQQAGQAAGAGLQQGLQQSSGQVADASALLGDAASGALAESLQVQSPSRVFRRIGLDTVAGLVQGVSERRGVDQSLRNLVDRVPPLNVTIGTGFAALPDLPTPPIPAMTLYPTGYFALPPLPVPPPPPALVIPTGYAELPPLNLPTDIPPIIVPVEYRLPSDTPVPGLPTRRELPTVVPEAVGVGIGGAQVVQVGPLTVDLRGSIVREEADIDRISQSASERVFGLFQREFVNAPGAASAGARYGRAG